MKILKEITKYAFLVMCMLLISCEDDDSAVSDILFLTSDTFAVIDGSVDLGDVNAGSNGFLRIVVEGQGLTAPLNLATTGENFAVANNGEIGAEVLLAAGARNIIDLFFTPPRSSALGPVDVGVFTVSGENGISKSISITANIIEPLPIEPNVVIYNNDMEFGIDAEADDKRVNADLLANTGNLLEGFGLVVQHSVSQDPLPGRDVDLIRIEADPGNARCFNNEGFEDNLRDGECGSGFVFSASIPGQEAFFEISLLGLEPGRSYIVEYWVRPGGSSGPRDMSVEITGDTEEALEDWSGLSGDIRTFFLGVTRTGVADADGKLSMLFTYGNGVEAESFRSIVIDDISVTTGPSL